MIVYMIISTLYNHDKTLKSFKTMALKYDIFIFLYIYYYNIRRLTG